MERILKAAVLIMIADPVSIIDTGQSSPLSVRITAPAMSLAGTILFIAAVLTMRNSWRAGISETDQTELITDGIYQVSRNPAFSGFDLLYIGTLFEFFNWILYLLTGSALVLYHLQILSGEKFLTQRFVNEYLHYKKKVCRYIGRKF